jgi:hypothetical protein
LAPLSAISKSWRAIVGKTDALIPRHIYGAWVQDDWALSPRLTLNLGLRYDLEVNAFAKDVELLPFIPGNRSDDTNNVSPRVGFNVSLTDRTVIRGGFGLYFGTVTNPHNMVQASQTYTTVIPYDGRPDFASNPFNGPAPTFESILPTLCTPALVPGCIRRVLNTSGFNIEGEMPYSYQPSIGLQRQLGNTMAIEADYVYVGFRKAPFGNPNINLTYDPATGANYPFRDISRRPYPEWDTVNLATPERFNSHTLQTAFTKRMSGGWQASGTYTLGVLREGYVTYNGLEPVPFKVAPDLGGEYGLAVSDQRHRAVVNGIWQLRYGVQLSGLYFFGSGERYPTSWGTDVRNIGLNAGERRLRPDGTIVPRNNFVGEPIHRVDLRILRRFPLGGRAGIDGMLEVFNVFNHANYGSYVTTEVSRNYGARQQNANLAYAPRTLQLGFRFAF